MDTVRILVVDDDARLRRRVAHRLSEHLPTATFGEAGTIAAAVELAGQGRWHVILLDIRLPDGNGLDACPRLRSLAPDAAIIVMTAQTDGAYGELVERLGGDAFLSKLHIGGHLYETVRVAIARRGSIGVGVGVGKAWR